MAPFIFESIHQLLRCFCFVVALIISNKKFDAWKCLSIIKNIVGLRLHTNSLNKRMLFVSNFLKNNTFRFSLISLFVFSVFYFVKTEKKEDPITEETREIATFSNSASNPVANNVVTVEKSVAHIDKNSALPSDSHLKSSVSRTESLEPVKTAFLKPIYEKDEHELAHDNIVKENQYLDLFSQAENLADFVLSSVHCEAETCQLQFLVQDTEQYYDITNALMEHLLKRKTDIKVSFQNNHISGEAVLKIEEQPSI